MRLDGALSGGARAVLTGFGAFSEEADGHTVRVGLHGLDPSGVPDLVTALVGAGARVLAVEPGRQTLEERLLGVLREGGDR